MRGTTWYLHGDNNALVFEKELKSNGVTENRHYLHAAGMKKTNHNPLAAKTGVLGASHKL
ncbi:MAG: hypothetical protein CFE38_09740 [Comamonadaceae bacterium PBBC1]|nr:MAG: hypothetical protein CFE38_09740 [Comamonadaceae bacterium PBBC1]